MHHQQPVWRRRDRLGRARRGDRDKVCARADPQAVVVDADRPAAKNGIQPPSATSSALAGMRFLRELELREPARRRLDSMLCLIDDFGREIDQTSKEIDARAEDGPYVEVLCQIHGLGRYIAMLVIAEVGDVGRFETATRLCAWAGLTPTIRSSDGRARLGHISRQGSPALRCDPCSPPTRPRG